MSDDGRTIVLYDAAHSPAGRRVRMTLIEKRLSFEIRWLNLALLDQKRPEYLVLNPGGLVPTLEFDGHVLFESNVINEFLDETIPDPRLVPATALERAKMRMLMAFEQELARPFRDAIYESYARRRLRDAGVTPSTLASETAERGVADVYRRRSQRLLTEPPNDVLLEESRTLLLERLAWLESLLADSRHWLIGESFTLADIALGPRLVLFPLIGMDDVPARFPAIGRYLQRLALRPSFRASDLLPAPGQPVTQVSVA